MAGDTRDTAPSQVPPQGTSSPKYDTFNTPPESANALPYGSGLNTAGSRKEAPSLTQAIKTVRIEDFKQVYMYPCARESLLMGIGGGFGMGGIRALLGGMLFLRTSAAKDFSRDQLHVRSCSRSRLTSNSGDTESCQLGCGNIRICVMGEL